MKARADFRRLWAAQTISELGSQVTLVAFPLTAILVLHASAFAVALLSSFEYLPFLVFGVLAGVWVDRLRYRHVLIFADVARSVVLGSIPVADAFGVLTIAQLYVAAFVAGSPPARGAARGGCVLVAAADSAREPVLVGSGQLQLRNRLGPRPRLRRARARSRSGDDRPGVGGRTGGGDRRRRGRAADRAQDRDRAGDDRCDGAARPRHPLHRARRPSDGDPVPGGRLGALEPRRARHERHRREHPPGARAPASPGAGRRRDALGDLRYRPGRRPCRRTACDHGRLSRGLPRCGSVRVPDLPAFAALTRKAPARAPA